MRVLLERFYPPLLSRPVLRVALAAVLVFQGLVLVGMYALSALPIITGTEIRLKTVPVDPRSLFRGNYALLRYDISRIAAAEFEPHQAGEAAEDDYPTAKLRTGEVVYVRLQRADSGLYEFAGAQLDEPDQGVFVRGRVRNFWVGEQPGYDIEYGIEAFFAPKEKALALERQLADSGVAVLKVGKSGSARVTEVVSAELH